MPESIFYHCAENYKHSCQLLQDATFWHCITASLMQVGIPCVCRFLHYVRIVLIKYAVRTNILIKKSELKKTSEYVTKSEEYVENP